MPYNPENEELERAQEIMKVTSPEAELSEKREERLALRKKYIEGKEKSGFKGDTWLENGILVIRLDQHEVRFDPESQVVEVDTYSFRKD